MCDKQPRGKRERRGGVPKISAAQPQSVALSVVMVETGVHSEFPAAVPCLSRPDYFLVQRLQHFPKPPLWPHL